MEDTVILVHTIFRHGDRTPEKDHIYPKDPYKNNDYAPYGHGNLTNDGKRRSYKLGQTLRTRYEKLLGDEYRSEYVDPWTSDFERTKMSLQLVLASLYPPKGEQIWRENLPWQPIPYKYLPKNLDKYFLRAIYNPASLVVYKNYVKNSGTQIMEKYQDTIKFVEENAGIKVYSPRNVLMLAGTLSAEQQMGLTLPDWTETVWPYPIVDIAMLEFDFVTANAKLKAFAAGNLLQKIVNDTRLKIDGQSKYKMHLYSGHDFSVAVFLKSIGLYVSHVPSYCAHVMLEVHKIDDIFGFKIYYKECKDDDVILLKFPNGEDFCSFDDFVYMIDDILKETTIISSL